MLMICARYVILSAFQFWGLVLVTLIKSVPYIKVSLRCLQDLGFYQPVYGNSKLGLVLVSLIKSVAHTKLLMCARSGILSACLWVLSAGAHTRHIDKVSDVYQGKLILFQRSGILSACLWVLIKMVTIASHVFPIYST